MIVGVVVEFLENEKERGLCVPYILVLNPHTRRRIFVLFSCTERTMRGRAAGTSCLFVFFLFMCMERLANTLCKQNYWGLCRCGSNQML